MSDNATKERQIPRSDGKSESVELFVEPVSGPQAGVFEVAIKGEESREKILVYTSPRRFAFQNAG